MTDLPPPQPPPVPPEAEPPDPSRAQDLVARSGFTVYEPGRTVFDQPVLVYLPRRGKRWSDFDIVDHVGRPLAREVKTKDPRLLSVGVPSRIVDTYNNPILEIRPKSGRFLSTDFEVLGAANGMFSQRVTLASRLTIEANAEPFGAIIGGRLSGFSGNMEIEDHDKNIVGEIRQYRLTRNPFSMDKALVMGIDPLLRGELRRLLVAAPPILFAIRRQQQGSS